MVYDYKVSARAGMGLGGGEAEAVPPRRNRISS